MTWAPGSSPSPRRAWPSRFRRMTNSGQDQTRSPSMSAGLSGWRAASSTQRRQTPECGPRPRPREVYGLTRAPGFTAEWLFVAARASFGAVDAPPRVQLRLVLGPVAQGEQGLEAWALGPVPHVHVYGIAVRSTQGNVGEL